jgi:3-oxoacyl-[acyl-carrier protein] reductase
MTDLPGSTGLSGRVAVVTGGTRGIGRASAAALAAAGATVVITGRDAAVAQAQAKELGPTVVGMGLDVTDAGQISQVFQQVAADHGRLDVLVASAGLMESGLLGMVRAEDVDRLLATNVTGTLLTVQAAGRIMMRRKAGCVIVLASVVGERGSAGQSAYAASKAAVTAIARSAAKELGGRGIRVNAIAPGVIDTELIADLPAAVRDRSVAQTPLGRLGTAADVAAAVRFLASDDASFITGQVLGVDGGLIT